MVRGPKKHLKRLNAPKHWMLDKLGGIFVRFFVLVAAAMAAADVLLDADVCVSVHDISLNYC